MCGGSELDLLLLPSLSTPNVRSSCLSVCRLLPLPDRGLVVELDGASTVRCPSVPGVGGAAPGPAATLRCLTPLYSALLPARGRPDVETLGALTLWTLWFDGRRLIRILGLFHGSSSAGSDDAVDRGRLFVLGDD